MAGDEQLDPSVHWADLAAGPATPASLCALAEVDAAALSGPELVDAVVCAEKAMSLILGVQVRLLAGLAVPFAAGDPTRLAARLARRSGLAGGDDSDATVEAMVPEAAVSLAAGEVCAALRIAPVTAGIRVREAVRLTEAFAPARKALEAGVIDRGKLRAIVEHVEVLPAESVERVLDQILPEAAERSTSEIREISALAVIAADPAGAAERHRQAAARRDLTLSPHTDAMATLKAFLPADGAVKVFQISDLLATGTAGVLGDDRGIGARRADALVDLADQLLTYGQIDLTGYFGRAEPEDVTEAPVPDSIVTEALDPVGAPAVQGVPTADTPTATASINVAKSDAPSAKATVDGLVASDPPAPDASAGTAISPAVSVRAGADVEALDTPAESTRPGPGLPPSDSVGSSTACASASDPAGRARSTREADRRPVPDRAAAPTDPETTGSETTGPATAGTSTADQNIDARRPTPSDAGDRNRRAMSRQGRRPHLTVTVGLDTLAGLNDLPGLLAGFGAIPADMARTIAASAGSVTAAVTDPASGAITDVGELTYRPRQALRDQVAALSDTCQFPSCRQPAWRCDIDHRRPFDHRHPERGGSTALENIGGLCRRHHLFKHHADWRMTVSTDRMVIDWVSPTGHSYARKARASAPPGIWIATAGSTIAEHLDHIAEQQDGGSVGLITDTRPRVAADRDIDEKSANATSFAEDLLTDALVRFGLMGGRPIEIDPGDPEPTGPGSTPGPGADRQPPSADLEECDDDPPPF